jgi:peptidoglycan/xylan/chitin deacetylase (PgdA/CDA1 family)
MSFRWTSALESDRSEDETGLPHYGALIVSLDFELLWGVRDLYPTDGGAYRENLLGVRNAIPGMLKLFEEFEIAVTWATVGFLFAENRADLEEFRPRLIARYENPALDPYGDLVGENEADDPLRYGADLLRRIRAVPRQEIASHTYSHYYPLEPGSDIDSFQADLRSAVAIAQRSGIELRSLVFPRNQFNPAYMPVLRELGFTNCRTNGTSWMYRESSGQRYRRPDVRAGRLIDTYVNLSGPQVPLWNEIEVADSIRLLPASRFLRPYSARLASLDRLRLHRINSAIHYAATERGLFHLWWHPHNFGRNTEENLAFLRHILETYRDHHRRYGMRSLSMAEAASLIPL